jgi:hypothetical protein
MLVQSETFKYLFLLFEDSKLLPLTGKLSYRLCVRSLMSLPSFAENVFNTEVRHSVRINGGAGLFVSERLIHCQYLHFLNEPVSCNLTIEKEHTHTSCMTLVLPRRT